MDTGLVTAQAVATNRWRRRMTYGGARRIWLLLAALAAIASACSSGADETSAAEPASTSAPTTVAPEQTTTSEAPAPTTDAPVEEEPDGTDVDPVFEQGAAVIEQSFGPINPGTHRVDAVGTPFSVTTTGQAVGGSPGGAIFVIADPGSQGPGDRGIEFVRVSHFTPPSDPAAPLGDADDGWPADDIDGWLDSVVDGIEISNRENVTVGGLEAVRFDVQVAEGFECGTDHCAALSSNSGATPFVLAPETSHRVWVVGQGDEAPLLINVAAFNADRIDWFNTAEEILKTLAFGPIEPNPIGDGGPWTQGFNSDVPAGTVELPALGGIRFELANDRFIVQRSSEEWHWITTDAPADTGLFIIDRDIEGNPISTIDELIAAVTSGSTAATEIEPATLGGFDARVFDIEKPASTPDAPLLLPAGADENGWRAPLAGRIWASETDRGLVMITASAFELASDLEVSLGQSELLVSTLEFIELG